ncbi:hypothetical protein KI688_002277 [Linnemannia hyalina]|uniref:Uncharacterized protein n=1 Tax=Linnemannia hyalina TaxID=64524 RepID=A0A9P8BQI0_9FUNG|nr:hypothetical protein KI688_002277 [Linnemannia hyalina]
MEPIPSNTTQVTASEVRPDDPIINDKLARGQIEQLVINALNEFGQGIAKTEFAKKDGEEDQNDIKKDGEGEEEGLKKEYIKTDNDVELLKARIAEGLNGVVLSKMRGILYGGLSGPSYHMVFVTSL